jgi:hypothetical protein
MASEEKALLRGVYYTIIEGTFRTKVEEGHPEGVRREYETKDGAKAIKYERIVPAITGYIEDIGIYDTDFGKVINVKLDQDTEGRNLILQFNAATNYGEDLMKKLPGVDFNLPVRFAPYSFTDEETGKDRRGVTMSQPIEGSEEHRKLGNFFYDTEKKEAINGYPTPEGDTTAYDKEDWKIYYLQARKFLLDYTKTQIIPSIPMERRKPEYAPTVMPDYPEEEVNPEDIPF